MSAESNMVSPASKQTSTSRVASATLLAPHALKNSFPPPKVPVPRLSTGTLRPEPPSCLYSMPASPLGGMIKDRTIIPFVLAEGTEDSRRNRLFLTTVSSGSFDLLLQPAPPFLGLGERLNQSGDFVVETKRLVGIGRFQQLSIEAAFLFVELGYHLLQSLDFLAHIPFVPLRGP